MKKVIFDKYLEFNYFHAMTQQLFKNHGSGDDRGEKHRSEALQKAVEALEPSFMVFDPHLWHTLLEYVKILSESTILFIFRNGRKETVDLMEK